MKMAHSHALKELCDVVYAAFGVAVICGYDMDAALLKVHASNMTKTRIDDDIKKLENYVEPTLILEAGYEAI